ncbi:hypothetical protein LJB79_01105 [Bacteroides sp. OttesenSCG-928-M17]|nr:hypothetical protein [Bacteroides sp. OttesenSCG-928-M17]
MMDFIMVPAILGIITFGIYKIFELYARRRERLMLIEKINDINSAGIDKISFPGFGSDASYAGLKWGALLAGLGIGLLIGYLICGTTIPGYYSNENSWARSETVGIIYGASVLAFGGIGLISAFVIEMKLRKEKK